MIRRRHLFIPRIPLSALRCRLLGQPRPLSASTSSGKDVPPPPATVDGDDGGVISREEAYHQIHNLDFMKAAKILFTTPPKRKQFGFDFHLVQFFFACMPSLAVYLVAQYARYEMRRMEAPDTLGVEIKQLFAALHQEAEVNKKLAEEAEEKAREEEKAKEAELRSLENESSDSELSKVMVRLDALEEVVKEIADEKRRTPSLDSKNDRKSDKNSDPQAKSRAIEPKPELNKETAGGSSLLTGVPSEKENKEKGR